jgi:hypothetical protein
MPDDRSGAPRRPRTRGANGFHVPDAPTAPLRFDDLSDVSDEPVDLVAVQADDELINALASGLAVPSPGIGRYDADDQVAALLAAWKAEVEAEPTPPLVDVEVAAARVRAASRPGSRRLRLVAPIAAAAVVALSVGGLGYNAGVTAGPDDGLAWEIAKVVDGERVESVLAAERVEGLIAEAKAALTRGEPEEAAQALAAAARELPAVRAEENAADLTELRSFLEAKAAETPPGTPTLPDTPLVSDPTRPVPRGARSGPVAAPELATVPVPSTGPAPPPAAPGSATAPEATAPPAPQQPAPQQPVPQQPVPQQPAPSPPSSVPTPPGTVDPTSSPPTTTGAEGGSAVPGGGLSSSSRSADDTTSASGSGTSDPTPSS